MGPSGLRASRVVWIINKFNLDGCVINTKYKLEVAELMRAVDRHNASGHFAWIGSDGWSARGLVTQG